jgi:hypothetical protein
MKFSISHMESKHGSNYVKWHGSIYFQLSYKFKIIFLGSIFVFLNTQVQYIYFHKYIPISYFIK